jgi:hypothetical protein
MNVLATGRLCQYRTCYRQNCEFEHSQGQHQPDDRKYHRTLAFSDKNYCRLSHEKGSCGKAKCQRIHGKGGTTGDFCQHIGPTSNTICEEFFSEKGCVKNHNSNLGW